LLHQGKDIFPIPGSRKIDRINENAKAIDIALYPEVLGRINKIAEIGITKGNTLL
jgi:aryl-alcohol dehydrogenase-like predicted oxidoreductase